MGKERGTATAVPLAVCKRVPNTTVTRRNTGRATMTDREMANLLDDMKIVRQQRTLRGGEYREVWKKLHHLAEAHYPPALKFFLDCLDDPDWIWRLDGLTSLGFHYQFPPDGDIVSRIQHLLVNDPEAQVRIAAASVLGGRSRWPDQWLRDSLQLDQDDIVRRAAFVSLLELAGVPPKICQIEEERVRGGAVQPTWEEVQRVIATAMPN